MIRPKCRRCGGPLDIWWGEEKSPNWLCNNPDPIYTDEQFERIWGDLDGDDVVRLQKELAEESFKVFEGKPNVGK